MSNLVKLLRYQARMWKVPEDQIESKAADRIEELEKALRVAAGYISTKEGHTDQHPQDVYDWIIRTASGGRND